MKYLHLRLEELLNEHKYTKKRYVVQLILREQTSIVTTEMNFRE